MVCLWEHINGLYGYYAIFRIKQLQVTRLRSRVTTHVNYTLGRSKKNRINYICVHTSTRGGL